MSRLRPIRRALLLSALLAAGCDRAAVLAPPPTEDTAQPTESAEIAVQDPTGAPISGAWVVLVPGGRDAESGPDGTAQFPSLDDGVYTARAAAAGFVVAEVPLDVGSNRTFSVVLEPSGEGWITGTAVDPGGAPVPGASVEIDGAPMASTDAEGWFSVPVVAGAHAVSVRPADDDLLPWDSPQVQVELGGAAHLGVGLAGAPPAGATHVGSAACETCHADQAAAHAASAHGAAGRAPGALGPELAALEAAVAAGTDVWLGAGVIVRVEAPGGTWQATISQGLGPATTYPIAEVYGGHGAGAALAVDAGGTLAVLPVAWARMQATPVTDAEVFVAGWTEGWLDGAGDLRADAPGVEASWDRACAGCHASGHVLTEGAGRYDLAADGVLERRVGCEACHGPGSAHLAAETDPEAQWQILNPGRLPGDRRVEVCARCHERVDPTAHPFTDAPGWPVATDGAAVPPDAVLADFADPAPDLWLGTPESRVGADQVGELRSSPHQRGPGHYLGSCEDCHDPHTQRLHTPDAGNELCTGCHAARFPDGASQSDHAAHLGFSPLDPWGSGRCVGCHMPRSATRVRPDGRSGAGELRSHQLEVRSPAAALATFDAAGETTLPLGSVPASGCLDCHAQVQAQREPIGGSCACPRGLPTERDTYRGLGAVYDTLFGGAP